MLVLRAGDGEAIGNINFRPRADGRKGNRGFWLAEPYWNQGLMTEAIAAVNDFAFLTLGLDHFHVCNAPSNVASRRVKQKTGAESSASSSFRTTMASLERRSGRLRAKPGCAIARRRDAVCECRRREIRGGLTADARPQNMGPIAPSTTRTQWR
ncbi:GNAT family N-acetyltransferase [Bradyrhizobium sp. RD5-C2]|uniref:GNAT family N-acetyltransferase n=1 Tax=Bradyrhizobium sp. RD5-C2 TaxID=244562 RepID=UPI001EBDA1D9|nr:GNAT family N-acetyltransferase [Bradyrhizobium sp. RD5-C2]GIQ76087.1 hypothetical protein BraRD5C2_45300 [Bradyrhizobium sp. RD5-C2]